MKPSTHAEPKAIIIEQEVVDQYETTLGKFFADIFGVRYETVLATDISQLSDFTLMGEDWVAPDIHSASLSDVYDSWDQWVLPRICAAYDLQPGSFDTRTTLVALMALIENRAARLVH